MLCRQGRDKDNTTLVEQKRGHHTLSIRETSKQTLSNRQQWDTVEGPSTAMRSALPPPYVPLLQEPTNEVHPSFQFSSVAQSLQVQNSLMAFLQTASQVLLKVNLELMTIPRLLIAVNTLLDFDDCRILGVSMCSKINNHILCFGYIEH